MRAKSVYESINFERGADPKDAMGVGLKERIYKDMYDFAMGFSGILGMEYKNRNGQPKLMIRYVGGISPANWVEMVKEDLGEYLYFEPGKVYWGDDYYFPIKEPYQEIIREILKEDSERESKKIKESVSFHKGRDPRSAMGIGRSEEYIASFAEEMDSIKGRDGFPWESYEDYVHGELEDDPGLMDKVLKCFRDGIPPRACAEKLHKSFDAGEVYEGINFERGKDPRESMKIGIWKDGYKIDKYPDFDDWEQGTNKLLHWDDWGWDKKVANIDDLYGETVVTEDLANDLDPLPVVTFKEFGDATGNGLFGYWEEDFPFRKIPFIANVEEDEGRSFLISPEGFDYARYTTELIAG